MTPTASIPATLRVVPTPIDDPVAVGLIAELMVDLTRRYGMPDPVETHPEQFWPPKGLFVVAWSGEDPVGCAGMKDFAGEAAELKRMYVAPRARGCGVARALLATLEAAARAAGVNRIRLITGRPQPEAVALYRSAGWVDAEAFGPAVDLGWHDAIILQRWLPADALDPELP